MAYVYNTLTGRIAAIFHQTAPVPPGGHAYTADAIQNPQIIDSTRDLILFVLVKKDALKQVGSNSIPRNTVGQTAVQKIDGTTLADKTAVTDADALKYVLENPGAFLQKTVSALVQGADSVKVAAPQVVAESRFLVFSERLQLFDGKVVFF